MACKGCQVSNFCSQTHQQGRGVHQFSGHKPLKEINAGKGWSGVGKLSGHESMSLSRSDEQDKNKWSNWRTFTRVLGVCVEVQVDNTGVHVLNWGVRRRLQTSNVVTTCIKPSDLSRSQGVHLESSVSSFLETYCDLLLCNTH